MILNIINSLENIHLQKNKLNLLENILMIVMETLLHLLILEKPITLL